MAIGLNIVDGDYVIKVDGQLETVDGTKKTARDFKKMLNTEVAPAEGVGSVRYNPNYGNKLNTKDYLANVPRNSLIDTINLLLSESIGYYLNIQEQRSNLSVEEVITGVDYLAYFDPSNSQRILIDISITTGKGEEVPIGEFAEEV